MNINQRVQVLTRARQARDWAEYQDLLCESRDYPSNDLNGWCAIASAHLSRLLAQDGIEHRICLAESCEGCHVFVTVGDYIVDVTATQFSEYQNEPVLLAHSRQLEHNWFHDPVLFFYDADSLRKHQLATGWPKNQTAYPK